MDPTHAIIIILIIFLIVFMYTKDKFTDPGAQAEEEALVQMGSVEKTL